jgi:hypothetical protein
MGNSGYRLLGGLKGETKKPGKAAQEAAIGSKDDIT